MSSHSRSAGAPSPGSPGVDSGRRGAHRAAPRDPRSRSGGSRLVDRSEPRSHPQGHRSPRGDGVLIEITGRGRLRRWEATGLFALLDGLETGLRPGAGEARPGALSGSG